MYLKNNLILKCDITTNPLIKIDIIVLYFLKDKTNLGANLIAALTGLDVKNFTHFVLIIVEF